MGASESRPMVPDLQLGCVAVAFRTPSSIRVLHAPPQVISVVQKVVMEINGNAEIRTKDKYGAVQFKLRYQAFRLLSGKTSATAGKLFCIRLFEEMHQLGYDPVVSSDLTRTLDQATLFFVKASDRRSFKPVVCLAPGQTDRLIMVRASAEFVHNVMQVISEAWTKGIQDEKKEQAFGETLHEVVLRGNPWVDYMDKGPENIHCRQMLTKLIGRLGSIHYKLLAGTNIKGGTDSFFFLHDPEYMMYPGDFCLISLNKNDRLRLVSCVELAEPIRDTLSRHFGIVQREMDKYGSYEFKLGGYPWHCSGDEAITARRLISRVCETMLQHGWALTTAIDICRSANDKSALLFTRAQPIQSHFACIALSDINKLRLLDFPANLLNTLRNTIAQHYLPGIAKEKERDVNCFQITLRGYPWIYYSSFGVHARCALAHVLQVASNNGWRLVASADVSSKFVKPKNGPAFPIDVHSWYFVYWPQSTGDRTDANTGSVSEHKSHEPTSDASPPSYKQAVGKYGY